ncbi:TIGR00730 family Rossman fold protein [Amycolatopsis suaedae]|uniref:Cytokinin riboside 5'-monophosphate phosphoribohydrolase n=1 Tax=Amycolatopsis suaedae TaxID=2510978 RepID=A0A4Q7J6C7_9PSEU|nr:TIGR00730 family Rossman fold protein [Amycolatopsis suaedae]RZQ62689.1 TIGR00730 family Rossman fold protein [Amycolatopsis suaedae]
MAGLRAVCVFCGSAKGTGTHYAERAAAVGRLLAERELTLVYGGAHVGTMGVLADATLAAGGEVVGVIPRHLQDAEVAHTGLTKLHVVETMHERKAMMADLSDAFLALPGGAGTLEELFEVWTWAQLGLHGKPVGLVDTAGYFGQLVAFADHMVDEGFLRPQHREMLAVHPDPAVLLERFASYVPPAVPKWA